MHGEITTQVVVIGSGPGGYSAAVRCADLGLSVAMIEKYDLIGGVCLHVGCIPSKSLLHLAKVINEVNKFKKMGIFLNSLDFDYKKIISWKNVIINRLSNGIINILKSRNIKIINGIAKFINCNRISVLRNGNVVNINFDYAIIASGSRSINLPFINFKSFRIWNSSDALSLKWIPKNLLIIGGGVIGLELATIYHSLGSSIDIVEKCDRLIPEIDKDISDILFSEYSRRKINFNLKTEIVSVEDHKDFINANMKRIGEKCYNKFYDAVLISVGRIPNIDFLDIHNIGIKLSVNGFISVDKQMRTNISNIYAIGDVTGHPMLAHKSIYEGHVVAEVIYGKKYFFTPKVIPLVIYTDPEIGCVGITEQKAICKKINHKVISLPWSYLGRAASVGCTQGLTKLIFDKFSKCIIGGSVIGSGGDEMLGEIALAIEMGCNASDLSLTVHPHPSFNESISFVSKMYEDIV